MKINSVRINSILFKSLIRSLSSSTQRIIKKLQSMQTRTLRRIKHFPLKTRSSVILDYFNLGTLETRTAKLVAEFAKTKLSHGLSASALEPSKQKSVQPKGN